MINFAELPQPAGLVVPRVPMPANASRVDHAWYVLHDVLDPEVPALSVCDLGIVRDVREAGEALEVDLTPTYSGCPATELIERGVVDALVAAGLGPVTARTVLSPAWTSDWISEEGRRKLLAYGIAPPGRCGDRPSVAHEQVVHIVRREPHGVTRAASIADDAPACPRCGSAHTETLSAFGATACKSLHRCLDCREPFEAFKAF